MALRKFLFLQGVATPFFKALALAIHNKGHDVFRVNFCGGDYWFSLGLDSWRYNDTVDKLPQWLAEKHHIHQFTDVVLFGDTRPIHQEAITYLRQQGVRVNVFEEGYLRPHWITLEQDGVNGYSHLLNQPLSFWQTPAKTDENTTEQTQSLGRSFGARAWHDIKYHLANALLYPLFSHYKSHRPFNALYEYAGWAWRMPTVKFWHARRDSQCIQKLLTQKTPYYLLPLQLDADSQIRKHSPYDDIKHVMRTVMSSFAQHAPSNSQLVIKNHPLATGLINHKQQAQQLASELGIQARILFLESGDLPTLLQHTQGTVLVNSTTGTSALFHGAPTCALGIAIFDLPGLTFQQGLDRFWREGQAANKQLYQRFRQLIIQHTQISGDFYSKAGIKAAVDGCLQRMDISDLVRTNLPLTQPTTDLQPAPSYGGGGQLLGSSYLYKQR